MVGIRRIKKTKKSALKTPKPRVGKEETPTIELKLANGLQLVEWQGEEWKIIDEWKRVEED